MSADSFDHVRCPICFFILIEPVSLPCLHRLCLACFDKQVEEVNYTCPICRHRISNWARIVSRENNLVDETLWGDIQRRFPSIVRDHLQNKIALGLITAKCVCATKPCRCDQTTHKYVIESPEKPPVNHNLAVPGEIAREYQEELQKAREEFKLKRLEEAKANEEYILANVSESKRKKLKTLLEFQQQQKHSETISKSAAEPTPLRSRSATGVSGSTSTAEDRNVCGPLYRSPSTSSIDSITPEIQGFLFKPIHCSPRTPPKRFGNAAASVDKQPPPMPPYVSYPPVIRSVPRVLDGGDTSSESSFASSCSSLSNFRGGPPQKFRRRYPTRASTRRPDGSSILGGSQSEMSSSLSPGSLNQLQQRQRYLTAVSSSQDKSSSPTVESMDCSGGAAGVSCIGANDFATLTSRLSSSTISTLVAAAAAAAAQEPTCQSPVTSSSRLGRSSRNSAAQLSGSGNKRKQHAPDEKENKRGATGGVCEVSGDGPDIETSVAIPDFKKLRLNSAAAALLQRSLESVPHAEAGDMSPDQLYPGATTALALSTSSTNKLDSSLFINHRKSGVEFLTWEAYQQFLEDKDSQVKLDYKLAKEIETQDRDCRSGSSSPVEERTYSLRKRKVVHKP